MQADLSLQEARDELTGKGKVARSVVSQKESLGGFWWSITSLRDLPYRRTRRRRRLDRGAIPTSSIIVVPSPIETLC